MPICWSCKRGGLCPDHFQKLTPKERNKLDSTHEIFQLLAYSAYCFGIVGVFATIGLWSNNTLEIPIYGILAGILTILCFLFIFKSSQWEVEKMDKIRISIHQRLRHPSRASKVGNLSRDFQKLPGGLNSGTKPVPDIDLTPYIHMREFQTPGEKIIICPMCSAVMPEGAKVCNICGNPM